MAEYTVLDRIEAKLAALLQQSFFFRSSSHGAANSIEKHPITAAADDVRRLANTSNLFPESEMVIPVFDGEIDAYWWVLCTEKYFKRWGILEADKMIVAAFAMKGHALTWWLRWYPRHRWVSWDWFTTAFLWQFKPEYRTILPLFDEEGEPYWSSDQAMEMGDIVVDNLSNVGAEISIPALGGMKSEEKNPIENGFAGRNDQEEERVQESSLPTAHDDRLVAVSTLIDVDHSKSVVGDVSRHEETPTDDGFGVRHDETTLSLSHKTATSPLFDPQDVVPFSKHWDSPDPPWPRMIWTRLMNTCLSRARRNIPMHTQPPKPPDWTHGAVGTLPPPPEPPDVDHGIVVCDSVLIHFSHFSDAQHALPFQLVTALNPSVLQENSVPIYNILQGVWPEPKSFSDEGLGPFQKKWCRIYQIDNGTRDTVYCNRKLIRSRYFYTGASVFGFGNGTARGGAPKAQVADHKIGRDGCYDTYILTTFEATISDGVVVLSVFVGGDQITKYFQDGIAIESFHAVANVNHREVIQAAFHIDFFPALAIVKSPIAGLTRLVWPNILLANFSSIFVGLYASVIVYQGSYLHGGLVYIMEIVVGFDKYTYDWQYRMKMVSPSSEFSTRGKRVAASKLNTLMVSTFLALGSAKTNASVSPTSHTQTLAHSSYKPAIAPTFTAKKDSRDTTLAYPITWYVVEYFETNGTIFLMLLYHISPNSLHIGRTLLHHAIYCNNKKVVNRLLHSGVDTEVAVQAIEETNVHPIHMVAWFGSGKNSHCMINGSGNLDFPTKYGDMALMSCVRYKPGNCFQVLLSTCADLGVVNSSRHCATSIANFFFAFGLNGYPNLTVAKEVFIFHIDTYDVPTIGASIPAPAQHFSSISQFGEQWDPGGCFS